MISVILVAYNMLLIIRVLYGYQTVRLRHSCLMNCEFSLRSLVSMSKVSLFSYFRNCCNYTAIIRDFLQVEVSSCLTYRYKIQYFIFTSFFSLWRYKRVKNFPDVIYLRLYLKCLSNSLCCENVIHFFV